MRRSISPRAAVLSVLFVLGVLLVPGIMNPLRGVRADTASSPSSASAVIPASRTAPTALDMRVTDTRMLVSVLLPAGWMPQPQSTTDVITLALVGPGSQTFSVGVIDNLTDLSTATQNAIDATRGDAMTTTVGAASTTTVGGENANTFTAMAHLPTDANTTVNEMRWLVVHQGRTFILVARGTMSSLADAQSIVSSLLFVDGGMTPMPSLPSSPSSPGAKTTASGQVVTNTNTDPVNVRAMPTTDAAIVVQIAPGDSATVTGTNSPGSDSGTTWIGVSYQGKSGYVRADLVSAPRMQGSATAPTATSIPLGSATRATTTPMPASGTAVAPASSPAPMATASATGTT